MNKICLVSLLLLLPGLAPLHAQSAESANTLMMTEVLFEQSEPGIAPYRVRMLFNASYLRLDDGNDDDAQGYILYDRSSHEIHNFNHEDQSHLLMKPLAHTPIEFKLNFRVDKTGLKDAPRIKGEVALQYDYYADDQLCKTSVNVVGLLVDLTAALIDYEQALVEQNKQTLSEIPGSVRTACYMANNYLHASDYLQTGFPLHVIDDQGKQRRLVSFSQVSKPAALLQQIAGYRLYFANPANL
ncbi:MAG: hypothetical protein H8E21_11605 [Gammaproteobacteria bacterium]|nr:hypothetical protein [Gammaproteobacteria bacterium]